MPGMTLPSGLAVTTCPGSPGRPRSPRSPFSPCQHSQISNINHRQSQAFAKTHILDQLSTVPLEPLPTFTNIKH